MKRLLIFGIVLLSLQGQGKMIDFDYSESGISFTYDLSDMTTNVAGDTITFSLPGFGDVIGDGLPTLPKRMEKFEVPAGMCLGEPIITETVDTLNGICRPAAKLIWESTGEVCSQNFNLDTNEIWPASSFNVVQTGIYRDRQLASVLIMPIRYDFSNNQFLISKQLHIEIPFLSSQKTRRIANSEGNIHSIDTDFYRHNLTIPIFEGDNEIMPLGSIYQPPKRAESILIVTPIKFKSEAERLAKWKQRMGYSVKVYTPAMDSHLLNSTNVYNIIKQQYDNDRYLEYVILFGGGYVISPMKSPITAKVGSSYITPYTDFYYGCLDDEDDEWADISVGRIPAHTLADAKILVDKTINYEKNPPLLNNQFFKTGLHISEWDSKDSMDDRNFIWTSEKIADVMDKLDYNVKKVYYAKPGAVPQKYPDGSLIPASLRAAGFKWNSTANDIVTNINAGAAYILCRGHGGVKAWTNMWFKPEHVAKLTNKSTLPFVFSTNCLSGIFYSPRNSYTSTDYSLCESLLFKENGGAIATIGSNEESTSLYNDYMTAGLFEAMFPTEFFEFTIPNGDPVGLWGCSKDKVYTIGRILDIGRAVMWDQANMIPTLPEINTNYFRYNRDVYHCLGDPTLKVYIQKPKKINILDIMTGNNMANTERVRIVIAGDDGFTEYQENLKLWGPELCIPGNDKISVIGEGYVPVLMEDVIGFNSLPTPSLSSIVDNGNNYQITVEDWNENNIIEVYDVYGNVIDKQSVTDEEIFMPKTSSFSIIVLKNNGEIVDSKIMK